MLVGLVPRLRRPSLASRVAPYVIDVSSDARDLLDREPVNPLPVFGLVIAPVLPLARRLTDVLGAGHDVTARRLRQAGLSLTVDEFRAKQLVWACVGGAASVVLSIGLSVARFVPLYVDAAMLVVAVLLGFVGRDYALQRVAAARMRRMAKELPTVLEFMTLSLSAGEGILDSIRRISRISHGALAAELGRVAGEVSTGVPLADSLRGFSSSLQIPALGRAVEQITGALERGTPLAEVLRAQAQDAREDAKRELLETSGKKEVAMLVPVNMEIGFLGGDECLPNFSPTTPP
jgi:tight adherence protein C